MCKIISHIEIWLINKDCKKWNAELFEGCDWK